MSGLYNAAEGGADKAKMNIKVLHLSEILSPPPGDKI
jgi:hypothetical protein